MKIVVELEVKRLNTFVHSEWTDEELLDDIKKSESEIGWQNDYVIKNIHVERKE